jgi:hypothetical protein
MCAESHSGECVRTLVESKAFEGEGHHVDEPAIKDQRPAGDLAVDETGRLAEANNFEALAWRAETTARKSAT